jgi:hypothetical protein
MTCNTCENGAVLHPHLRHGPHHRPIVLSSAASTAAMCLLLQNPNANGTDRAANLTEIARVSALVLAITQRGSGFIGTLHSACELILHGQHTIRACHTNQLGVIPVGVAVCAAVHEGAG